MKKMKKALATLLALGMLLSLAACGGKDEKTAQTPEATETPEFAYQANYTKLEGTDYIQVLAYADDGFYTHLLEKVGEDIPEGVTPEYEGQYDVYEDRYFFVDFSGKQTPIENLKNMDPPENTENHKDFSSGSSINSLFAAADGKLLVLEQVYVSYNDSTADVDQDPDKYWQSYENYSQYYIRTLEPDGTEISAVQADIDENMYLYSGNTALDEKGNLVAACSDENGNWNLISLSPADGKQIYKVASEDYIDRLVPLKDGRLAYSTYGMEGQELRVIDSATGKFTESYPIPNDAYNLIPGDENYDFYYSSGVKLYGFDLESGEKTQILDWIACDVDSSNLDQIHVSPSGVISGICTSWERSGSNTMSMASSELVTMEKVPYASLPQKEHLTMAMMYLDYQIQSTVIDFNRSHDDVRIDIKDYSEYNTEEDYSAGLTKLTTEILSGNVPDLLYMNGLPYEQLAAKGLLVDLYPYLDADKDLNRDSFFDSVLKAQEVDGGLYQLSSSFTISTVAGAKSVVGDRSGWTYRDLLDALATMPEGCDIFDPYYTREQMLRVCLSVDMENLVDWTEGKCSFDSQDFLDILEFANRFPETFDDSNYDYSLDSGYARVARGEQMLMQANLYDFNDFQTYDYYFGGPGEAVYIGFPTSDGSSGSALALGSGYGIGANCANKDAAWEFIRSLFDKYNGWGFSTCRKFFDESMEEAMTPDYQTDAEGNVLLDEDGNKIEISHMSIGFGDGTTIEIHAMTQAQADQLLHLIDTTTKTLSQDEKITEMVVEEAQPYFKGQKSAEDVAKLIQSKVNIYVNEQK